jgi:uracil-DNA glycosylase
MRSLRDISVVIIGQDPYFKPNQATGLAFAVPDEEAVPDSLKKIYAEILRDTGKRCTQDRSLEAWARQGVLLLNSVLTVCEHEPKAHYGQGWEEFTDAAVLLISARRSDIVFCLWGAKAQEKKRLIDCTRHYVLPPAGHPTRGGRPPFAGCAHFSQANRLLKAQGRREITW